MTLEQVRIECEISIRAAQRLWAMAIIRDSRDSCLAQFFNGSVVHCRLIDHCRPGLPPAYVHTVAHVFQRNSF